jgi:hypothetical protein
MSITAIKKQIESLESILKSDTPLEHVIMNVWEQADITIEDINYSLKWLREELARQEKAEELNFNDNRRDCPTFD